MRIGINASFLRKPGTGIGQVTLHFLQKLVESTISNQQSTFVLYTEEPIDMRLPENFQVRSFLPFWKRDDLLRKVLWERQVAKEAKNDGCTAFLSLYQCSTVFQKSSMNHTMVVHDLIPRLFPEYRGNWRQRFHWRATEKAIRRADRIVAVSQATADDLVEFGIERAQVRVAHPDTAPLFQELPSSEEENRVMTEYHLVPGYIYHGGGLEIRKNTAGLLRAYQLLHEREKKGTLPCPLPPLVISGKIFSENNPLATPVVRLIQELDLHTKVRLLDFVPEKDLPSLYRNALFFAYPSLYEGFGLPVLEARRMGIPILTADNSSLPEVAGEAALYIDPENPVSLAAGMERLIHEPLLRQELALATKNIPESFSYPQFVKTIIDSFE